MAKPPQYWRRRQLLTSFRCLALSAAAWALYCLLALQTHLVSEHVEDTATASLRVNKDEWNVLKRLQQSLSDPNIVPILKHAKMNKRHSNDEDDDDAVETDGKVVKPSSSSSNPDSSKATKLAALVSYGHLAQNISKAFLGMESTIEPDICCVASSSSETQDHTACHLYQHLMAHAPPPTAQQETDETTATAAGDYAMRDVLISNDAPQHPCENSTVRIETRSKLKKSFLLQSHQAGKQLTSAIRGASVDKALLHDLIAQSNDPSSQILRDMTHSALSTQRFECKVSCTTFCEQERKFLEGKWLWKPVFPSPKKSIQLVGNETECMDFCDTYRMDGLNYQAQRRITNPFLVDGFKIDIHKYLLVANAVEPPVVMILDDGVVTKCVEEYYKSNAESFPEEDYNDDDDDSVSSSDESRDDSATTSDVITSTTTSQFDPFQSICSINVMKRHSRFRDASTTDIVKSQSSTLSEIFSDKPAIVARLNEKMDQSMLATAELLKHNWQGSELGMFQLYEFDFVVDDHEDVFLLEVNEQPEYIDAMPSTFLPDIIRTVWNVTSALQHRNDTIPSVSSPMLDTAHILDSAAHEPTSGVERAPRSIIDSWNVEEPIRKEVCSVKYHHKLAPFMRTLFSVEQPKWRLVRDWKYAKDACENSALRILTDDYTYERKAWRKQQVLYNHKSGKQLTATIYNSYIDKSLLNDLIKKSPPADPKTAILKHSIPETVTFGSKKDCHRFCWQKSLGLKRWIWKITQSSGGKGIFPIQNETSCHQQCQSNEAGSIQAQYKVKPLLDAKGRKFDVRVYMLVANVDPLIVFKGPDWVKMCFEPYHSKNPVPYPRLDPTGTLNPFQNLCNYDIAEVHPDFNTNLTLSMKTDEVQLLQPNMQKELLGKFDAPTLAVAELLRHRWQGRVGMFHMFALDYLVDENAKPYLLEVNKQPGIGAVYPKVWPTVWVDMLKTVWEVFDGLNHKVNMTELRKRLEAMQNENTFQILKVGEEEGVATEQN